MYALAQNRAKLPACERTTASMTPNGNAMPNAQIEIKIHDCTPGFSMPKKSELPEDAVEHGRGIFIMQSIMDDVIYLRGRDRNTMVLRKFRAARQLKHCAEKLAGYTELAFRALHQM